MLKELRTWNWEAIIALLLAWVIVFYEVLKGTT